MLTITRVLFASATLLAGNVNAQFGPGFVDPEPVLRAAENAIGAKALKCVTIAGTAYAGIVGQTARVSMEY